MNQWKIEPLSRDHRRDNFESGRAELDEFLRLRVNQYDRRRLGKTFVAVLPGDNRVLGYYTLAAGAVAFEHLPPKAGRKLPRHPLPAILIARLAVDRSEQRKGLGEALLIDALQRSGKLSEALGVYAVAVEAIDDSAAAFYRKYGFASLVDNPLKLYLPLSVLGGLSD